MLNLQQNRKKAFDKIPEMFVNCKQSYVFSLQKVIFFIFIQLIWQILKQLSPYGSVNSARYITIIQRSGGEVASNGKFTD